MRITRILHRDTCRHCEQAILPGSDAVICAERGVFCSLRCAHPAYRTLPIERGRYAVIEVNPDTGHPLEIVETCAGLDRALALASLLNENAPGSRAGKRSGNQGLGTAA